MPSIPPVRAIGSGRRENLLVLAAALLFGAVWFARLGERDLAHPDEGRYAEIPREMVASGDWVTPRLDGLKYFEKPPLQYWATAVGYELFGAGNATARLWPAGLGFLGVLWIGFVGRRLFGKRAGALAAIVLGSSLLWVGMGHILTLDMGLSFFLSVAFGSLAIAQRARDDPRTSSRWMLVAWIASAAAVLSKGPVALVLLGGTVAIYGLWQRDRELAGRLRIGLGLAVLLLLSAPWFVLVSLRNPGFADFFFVHEHLLRYATTVSGRVHPWWTFLAVVVAGSLPWVGTAVAALVRPGFERRAGDRGFDAVRLLWVACLFTVLFFSASRSKLVPYVLPAFPPLALLAGRRLAERPFLGWDAVAAAVLAIVILVAALRPNLFGHGEITPQDVLAYRPFVLAASGLLLAGALSAAFLRRGLAPAGALAAAGLLALMLLLSGYQRLSSAGSSRRIAEAIRGAVPAEAPVYCVELYDQPLPFYLGRTVDLVKERGELAFGLEEDPARQIPEVALFVERWRRLEQGAAVLSRERWASMSAEGVPMRSIYEDPRFVAVARR
jgi:4-amino-4-deoxy-L-arabinose transferase-like glycosyltransferase